jgi:hypothetical protein
MPACRAVVEIVAPPSARDRLLFTVRLDLRRLFNLLAAGA